MKELAQLLNEMQRAGVIRNYALFGAVAQMRYTEPVATLDADVLVAVPAAARLEPLSGIYEFCAARGYRPENEAMSDVQQSLNRQAQWQRSRQSLTWPEKIRLAERVLESVRQWRARPSPVIRRPADRRPNAADVQ